MIESSREARAEAPTATKPEAAGYSVISIEQTINQPERPGDTLPAARGAEEVPA